MGMGEKGYKIMKNLLDFKSFCESLYAKERSSQKIQNLFYRLRVKHGVTVDNNLSSGKARKNVTLNLIQGLYRFRLGGRNDSNK